MTEVAVLETESDTFQLKYGLSIIGSNITKNYDNVVIKHPSVCDKHAVINLNDSDYKIMDLCSTNGTFINDKRIEILCWHSITKKSTLKFGDVIAKFTAADESTEESSMVTILDSSDEEYIQPSQGRVLRRKRLPLRSVKNKKILEEFEVSATQESMNLININNNFYDDDRNTLDYKSNCVIEDTIDISSDSLELTIDNIRHDDDENDNNSQSQTILNSHDVPIINGEFTQSKNDEEHQNTTKKSDNLNNNNDDDVETDCEDELIIRLKKKKIPTISDESDDTTNDYDIYDKLTQVNLQETPLKTPDVLNVRKLFNKKTSCQTLNTNLDVHDLLTQQNPVLITEDKNLFLNQEQTIKIDSPIVKLVPLKSVQKIDSANQNNSQDIYQMLTQINPNQHHHSDGETENINNNNCDKSINSMSSHDDSMNESNNIDRDINFSQYSHLYSNSFNIDTPNNCVEKHDIIDDNVTSTSHKSIHVDTLNKTKNRLTLIKDNHSTSSDNNIIIKDQRKTSNKNSQNKIEPIIIKKKKSPEMSELKNQFPDDKQLKIVEKNFKTKTKPIFNNNIFSDSPEEEANEYSKPFDRDQVMNKVNQNENVENKKVEPVRTLRRTNRTKSVAISIPVYVKIFDKKKRSHSDGDSDYHNSSNSNGNTIGKKNVSKKKRDRKKINLNNIEVENNITNISEETVVNGKRTEGNRKLRVQLIKRDIKKYSKIVKSLGGDIVRDRGDLLIAPAIVKTRRLICAFAKGIPILDCKWIEDSKKMKMFADHNKYILKDEIAENLYNFNLKHSLKLAQEKRLFKDYFFFIADDIIKPNKADLVAIIKSTGGKNVFDIRKFGSNSNIIIISTEFDSFKWKGVKSLYRHVKIINYEALVTAIFRQSFDYDENNNY